MRSPLGDPVRSESVAGMDMLNDMFQRQARRLEAQLYQRAQDQRTIEVTQRQAQIARAQVRRLEQTHCEQAARILQGAKSLQQLQQLIRETLHVKQEVLGVCEELEREVAALREALGRVAPGEAEKLPRRRAGSASDSTYSVEALRQRAGDLERQLADTERSALQQIGATPSTLMAMSSDYNPLNDLSAVADYASKANVAESGAYYVESAPASTHMPMLPLQTPSHGHMEMHAPTAASMAMSSRYPNTAPYAMPNRGGDRPVPMMLSRDLSFEQRPY